MVYFVAFDNFDEWSGDSIRKQGSTKIIFNEIEKWPMSELLVILKNWAAGRNSIVTDNEKGEVVPYHMDHMVLT